MRCKSGNLGLDEALGHFNSVIQMNPIPSIWAINHLFGALSKMNQRSAVVSMYKQMLACVGLQPEVCTLNIVINCLCRMNRVDLGFSVLATTLKHGLQPNAYTLNALHNGEKGLACSEVTYARIINLLCRTGKTCIALEILEHNYQDGRFKPNPQCYNPIIDSLCKERRVDQRALALFEIMNEKGIIPDVVTFTSLIPAACKSGKWEEAVRLFRNLIDCGALPNILIFNSALDALCKDGKTAEALNLVEEMLLRGVKPDLVTYNSLIN
ncbi:hypothetical protein PRUPE_1G160300 [Prunus persica]|uniref:Pentacotripeptide-repeat region of PRORP domain-containing protein n=1 Tax=Prunus persica TaxID=3760 RepID=A0A251QZA4_PRUPE|nr:hypothetical protein PRUPE_1G160300 [Prunus persica]